MTDINPQVLENLIKLTDKVSALDAKFDTRFDAFDEKFQSHIETDKVVAEDVKQLVALKDQHQGQLKAQRGFAKLGGVLMNAGSAIVGALITVYFGNKH